MRIDGLSLDFFRNYVHLDAAFDPNINVIYGDNAQGKTNILEAVYLAGTSKSHKGSKDREMIRFENEESHIRMMVKKGGLSYKVEMHLRKNNIRNKLLFLSRSIVRKTHPNAIHDILGISTNLIYDTALYEI